MIKQAQWIKDFCEENGFKFIDCNEVGIKLPCSLDKNYKENNDTLFIQGFQEGSLKVGTCKGGLKTISELRLSIDKWDKEHIKASYFIPKDFTCDKCKKNSLNLRTQDNHKTYDCPECILPNENESKR